MQKKPSYRELEKQAEEFRGSEQKYHDLYKNAPIAYFSVNSDDGSILRVNSEAVRLLGYNKQDLKRMKVFDLYANAPNGVPRAKAVFERFQAGNSIREEELQMKRKDGKSIWINLNVEPVRVDNGQIVESRSMVIDISKRKVAEVALQKSERRYRLLVETMNDGFSILDSLASIKYLNDKFCEMLGYQRDEIVGRPISHFIPESDQKIFKQQFARRKKMKSSRYEMAFIRKDGHEIPTIVSGAPIFDDGKHFKGAFAVITDISDRKKMETELKTRAAELEKLNTALKVMLKKREQDKTALLNHKSELEKANVELLETNKAVSFLARNIDKNRQETQNSTATAINYKIMPVLKDLRKVRNLENLQTGLDILATNVQSITSDLTDGMNLMASLTPAEVRVATMIKNDLESQKIADKLFISLHTVKTHRRNIRKKLNIKHAQINLGNYLKSIMW